MIKAKRQATLSPATNSPLVANSTGGRLSIRPPSPVGHFLGADPAEDDLPPLISSAWDALSLLAGALMTAMFGWLFLVALLSAGPAYEPAEPLFWEVVE